MKRGLAAGAAAITIAAMLTGCGEGEPQTAATVTVTATATAIESVTGSPSAEASAAGRDDNRTPIWIMIKWEPGPGEDYDWAPGVISTAIDGDPVDVRTPIMIPPTVGGDYFRRPFMLEPGHRVSVSAGVDSPHEGEVTCIIWNAETTEEVVTETDDRFSNVACNYEMPAN